MPRSDLLHLLEDEMRRCLARLEDADDDDASARLVEASLRYAWIRDPVRFRTALGGLDAPQTQRTAIY